MTRTVLLAGLALKTHGSLVKGWIPLRAAVAGLSLSFIFNMPASLKEPAFFTCVAERLISASTALFTSFLFKPVFSATVLSTADWLISLALVAVAAFFVLGNMPAAMLVAGEDWLWMREL
eukprot:CAMPEP_0178398736 /NCGR_PEP_ID=MMETSP0689_2-20121128/14924_1 /TAXON_ID=160604 /ORGANISM="Amphidinium massartii, Strain CS-259" /LENGTH=119 /DNA_ID=CAMNT_0020019503 /DNA_START=115 /DNA_END=474 /DNA_ORIENTATION=+